MQSFKCICNFGHFIDCSSIEIQITHKYLNTQQWSVYVTLSISCATMIKFYATLNIRKKSIKIRNFDHLRNFEIRNNDQGRVREHREFYLEQAWYREKGRTAHTHHPNPQFHPKAKRNNNMHIVSVSIDSFIFTRSSCSSKAKELKRDEIGKALNFC